VWLAALDTFGAIYGPVCGGIYSSTFCYSIPDICEMKRVGNSSLRCAVGEAKQCAPRAVAQACGCPTAPLQGLPVCIT
jgi:hypothetical protein